LKLFRSRELWIDKTRRGRGSFLLVREFGGFVNRTFLALVYDYVDIKEYKKVFERF
jgi:hypothetical protein